MHTIHNGGNAKVKFIRVSGKNFPGFRQQQRFENRHDTYSNGTWKTKPEPPKCKPFFLHQRKLQSVVYKNVKGKNVQISLS